jgi:hypothetical protein
LPWLVGVTTLPLSCTFPIKYSRANRIRKQLVFGRFPQNKWFAYNEGTIVERGLFLIVFTHPLCRRSVCEVPPWGTLRQAISATRVAEIPPSDFWNPALPSGLPDDHQD